MAVHRAYNQSFVDGDFFYKCSQEDRLADEINYYDQLPKDLKPLFPQRYQYTYPSDQYVLLLKNIPGHNLGQEFLSSEGSETWSNSDDSSWGWRCDQIQRALNLLHQQTVDHHPQVLDLSIGQESRYLATMYEEKTEHEFRNIRGEYFEAWEEMREVTVNGQTLRSFWDVWEELEGSKIWNRVIYPYSSSYQPTMIHGDFCFSNMLISGASDEMFLIDPRGSFGRRGIWGDPRYDYAKLKHSYDGLYEAMIYDQFKVSVDPDDYTVELEYRLPEETLKRQEICQRYFKNKMTDEITLIEGMIFMGMIARHSDSLDRQIAMYVTGLQRLNSLL